jgi:hypothetical protein
MVALVAACGGASPAIPPAPPVSATTPSGQPVVRPASTVSASPGSAPNACLLITEAEATAFLGSDPGVGVMTTTDTATACSYGGSLVVSVEPGDGQAQFDQKKRAVEGQNNTHTLSGVGDAAFAFVVGNTIADMEILKGSSLMSVLVQGNPSLQNITPESLQALGATTVGRL